MKFKESLVVMLVLLMIGNLFIGMNITAYAEDTALAAHFKFDGDTSDSSGNGNDGASIIGNITYTDGPLGKAAVFDGKSYIEVNDSDSLDLGSQFTFSVWINHEPIPSLEYHGIMVKLGNVWDSDLAYGLGMTNLCPYADRYDADYQNIGKNGRNAERRIEAEKWQLLTITYDGSVYKYFNNGELIAQKEAYGGTTVIESHGKLQIGMDTTKSAFYRGRLDDLRIYNRLLSQQEIKGLYNEALNGSGKELVERPDRMIGYYAFNEGCTDSSGFNNNGTAIGNITFVDSIASKGAKINGSSYIEVMNSDSLQIDKGFTASTWLKLDAASMDQLFLYPLLEKLGGSLNMTEHAYWLGIVNGATSLSPWFKAYGFNGGDPINYTELRCMAETNMKPGKWSMLTQTFNGKEAKIYIDGKLIYTETLLAEDTIIHSKGKLVIGKTLHDDKNVFTKGIIDELRLYNFAMDEAAVKKLYTLKDSISLQLPDGKQALTLKIKGSIQLSPQFLKYAYTPDPVVIGTGTDSFIPAEGLSFTYKSLDPKVAVVNEKGSITAVGKGKATIQISCGEATGYLIVTVN